MIPTPTLAAPQSKAPDPEWRAYAARCAREAPAWAYDPEYITSHALEILPRICAEIGTGEAIAAMPRPAWWIWPAIHQIPDHEPILAVRAKLGSYALLFIDRATGDWDCPAATRRGETLVALAAWRWRITDAKAAWRLAKLCGLRRPLAA